LIRISWKRFENRYGGNPLATNCSSCLIAADERKGTIPHFSANRRARRPMTELDRSFLVLPSAASRDQDRRSLEEISIQVVPAEDRGLAAQRR
jgi:hypothetical protein